MRNHAKKLLSLVLALCLALALLPAAALAADGSTGSGSASLPKLSKQEIADLLNAAPTDMPGNIFVSVPSCTAPYATGQVRQEVLDMAAARLSALRRLAGLPAVTADPTLCAEAQYGAVILGKLGTLSHTPSQPADMDDDFYKKAYDATSSSNLYAGMLLLNTPDGFMDDSDGSNVSRVGHRRWQLNPSLGKVGFGYVDSGNGYKRFTAEKVFDRSGSCSDYDYVAWPASGYFPNNLAAFEKDTAWSVTVNPSRYQQPSLSSVQVTLTRQSDGKSWSFSGQNSYTPASSGLYFNIETSNRGVNNCIIFRPDGIDKYEGIYEVEITGLKNNSGSAAELRYQVDFFDTRLVESEQPTTPDKPTTPDQPTTPTTILAIPTNDKLTVDGKAAVPAAFKIDGNNYFKLRDVAALLDGTKAQFSVDWDPEANAATITTGQAYTRRGDELQSVPTGNSMALRSQDAIYINGVKAELTIYKINQDNYVKLRDLAKAVGFNAGWDPANSSMYIESDKPYTDAD